MNKNQNYIKIPSMVKKMMSVHFRQYYSQINRNWRKGVGSSLSNQKALERSKIIKKLIPQKAKILEIGSGSGIFLANLQKMGYVTYGVEPDQSAYLSSKKLFEANKLNFKIYNTKGEKLPFKSNNFDFVCSFQVIEHVNNPLKVFKESARVLKTNGVIYFVIPNYHSFWEGHYGIFWLPFLNKKTAEIYLSLFKRNKNFINEINFITPKIVKNLCREAGLEIVSLGENEWKKRLEKGTFRAYGGSKKLLSLVKIIKFLKINALVAKLGLIFEFYYPIVLIAKKTKKLSSPKL